MSAHPLGGRPHVDPRFEDPREVRERTMRPRLPRSRDLASDAEPDLQTFRPPPSVLAPPGAFAAVVVSSRPPPIPRADLARLAEQLVTRLRVGRSRDGAVVELRLAVAGRDVEVRLRERDGEIEVELEGADDRLRAALNAELSARGVTTKRA